MKRIIILLLALTALRINAQDYNKYRPASPDYVRGMEYYNDNKILEALELFNKDLIKNPKNGYSYCMIAFLTAEQNNKEALSAVDKAIKLLPPKDTEFLSLAYSTRSNIYYMLEDTAKALSDLSTAITIKPDIAFLYEKRGMLYKELGKYELAENDFRQSIKLDPGEISGYLQLGGEANRRKDWDSAIQLFNSAINLDSDNSLVYALRAEAYNGKAKYAEATDDIMKALSLDASEQAFDLALKLEEPASTMLISKLKIKAGQSPDVSIWPYIIASIYQQNRQFKEAAEFYEKAYSEKLSSIIDPCLSECYYELGNYEKALDKINKALKTDSTNLVYVQERAEIYTKMGENKKAIAEWNSLLSEEPGFGGGYWRRGCLKSFEKDTIGAIKDLSMAIFLDPEQSYPYNSRADIYMRLGENELAEADYRKIIEIEDSPEKYNRIPFAYQGLGDNDKAVATIKEILNLYPDDPNVYYAAACLYSRMKDKANALTYLKESLKRGFRQFARMENDYEMDFLRNSDEFKALIAKYKYL